MCCRLRAKPEDRIESFAISYENVLQSLPFYLHRRIFIEGDAGELELGRAHAADADEWFLPSQGAQDAFRNTPLGTWVITSDEAIKYLRSAGSLEPFEFVAREGDLQLLHKVR